MNPIFAYHRLTCLAMVLLIGLFCTLYPLMARAAIIPVTTTDHGVVVDGACSLVEAITAANTNTSGNGCPAGDDSPVDTIVLAADALYSVTSIYTPTGSMTGLPAIASTIVISGNGAVVERAAVGQFRLLSNHGNLTLQDVTLRYGSAQDGGAIWNEGDLTVLSSRIISNTAEIRGGGISNNEGRLYVADSVIADNHASRGGGIDSSGLVIITNTQILSNTAASSGGGGIRNYEGRLYVANSTIIGNQASRGGGIESDSSLNAATVMLTETHVVDNFSASNGGGIHTGNAHLSLTNSWVANNNAETAGGGIYQAGIPTSRLSSIIVTGSEIISNTASNGGGIYNHEEIHTITNTNILSNVASSNGGGVYNRGIIVIRDSNVSSNYAGLTGGGVYQDQFIGADENPLTISNSRLLNNTAGETGAVLQQVGGTSSIGQSCIVGNSAVAVNHAGGSEIDARNNWWGAPSGPSGVAQGAGDSVSENVAYTPFYTSTILGCPAPGGLGLPITKSAHTSQAFAGETITYTYFITNTGTETFTAISAVDDHLGAVIRLDGELPPQATRSATLTYVVASDDIPGPLVNRVVVTGTTASGASISKMTRATVTLVVPILRWSQHIYDADEGIGTFTATLTMTPTNPYTNVTVEVVIRDTSGINPESTQLITFPTNSGSQPVVVNVVDDPVLTPRKLRLILQSPSGAALDGLDYPYATVNLIENEVAFGLQVAKTANKSHAFVGESILYTYIVTNTGVEPLTVSNAVDDHQGLLAALIGEVAPRASRSVTLSYVVQESDLPGPLVNTVVVTGNDGKGNTIIRNATATVELTDFTMNLPHIQR